MTKHLRNIKKFFSLVSSKLKILLIASICLGIIKSFIVFFGLAIIIPVSEFIVFDKTSLIFLQNLINDYEILQKFSKFQIAIFLVTYLIVIQIFLVLYDYFCVSKLTNRINKQIVLDFLSKFIKSNLTLSERISYSDIITLVNIDIRRSVNGILKTTIYFFVNGFFFILFIFFMFFILDIEHSNVLAIFLIGIFLFYFLSVLFLKRTNKKIGFLISENNNIRERLIRDLFNSIKSIKFFRNLKYFVYSLDLQSKLIHESHALEENINQWTGKFLEVIIYSIFIISLAYSNTNYLLSEFPKYLTILFLLLKSYGLINQVNKYLSLYLMNFASLRKMIDINEIISNNIEKHELVKNVKKIKFKNVKIENQFISIWSENLEIYQGDRVAILGKNGSGKTTFLDVLLNLKSCQSGEIFYDEKIFTHKRLRASYCTVNGSILNCSLEQNITLDEKQNIDTEKLDKILRLLDIENLKQKNNKDISSLNISAGEKQKILLARALYPDFEFLCLDEVFSNIDQKTEIKIMNNINNFLEKNITLISIVNKQTNLDHYNKFIIINKKLISEVSKEQALNFFVYDNKQ